MARPSNDDIIQQVRKWQDTPYKLKKDEKMFEYLILQLEKYYRLNGSERVFMEKSCKLEAQGNRVEEAFAAMA